MHGWLPLNQHQDNRISRLLDLHTVNTTPAPDLQTLHLIWNQPLWPDLHTVNIRPAPDLQTLHLIWNQPLWPDLHTVNTRPAPDLQTLHLIWNQPLWPDLHTVNTRPAPYLQTLHLIWNQPLWPDLHTVNTRPAPYLQTLHLIWNQPLWVSYICRSTVSFCYSRTFTFKSSNNNGDPFHNRVWYCCFTSLHNDCYQQSKLLFTRQRTLKQMAKRSHCKHLTIAWTLPSLYLENGEEEEVWLPIITRLFSLLWTDAHQESPKTCLSILVTPLSEQRTDPHPLFCWA